MIAMSAKPAQMSASVIPAKAGIQGAEGLGSNDDMNPCP